MEHIQKLAQHTDDNVRALAEIVLEIARVKPHKRRRMQVIARGHPDLFIDMVAVLGDVFWDDFFFGNDNQPEWLHEQYESAQWQIRFQVHGKSPCWCGSGRSYWLCCADRDDVFAEQLAVEEQEREWTLNPDSIPWWHPDSRVDCFTRAAYELFYADPDHPWAMRGAGVAGGHLRKKEQKNLNPPEGNKVTSNA